MFLLKGCPKCRGDLQILDDRYGSLQRCLQCGWAMDRPTRLGTSDRTDTGGGENDFNGVEELIDEMVVGQE
jgi:hypothetical protein